MSEKIARLSDTQILLSFRDALVALYPILQRLDCISDDTQPYDSFDRVAESLWEVLVLESLQWKYGLAAVPRLPRYGFSDVPPGQDGYIQVHSPASQPFRFIEFLGQRDLGVEPFNAVRGVSPSGTPASVRIDDRVSFAWIRGLE